MWVSCNSLHKRIFDEISNIYLFSHRNCGRRRHKIGYRYLNFLPESDFFFTKRRRIDVRRVMPSFMSISVTVQELFLKNEGRGRKTPPPPRRLRVNIHWILWPDGVLVLFSVCDLYSLGCPRMCTFSEFRNAPPLFICYRWCWSRLWRYFQRFRISSARARRYKILILRIFHGVVQLLLK